MTGVCSKTPLSLLQAGLTGIASTRGVIRLSLGLAALGLIWRAAYYYWDFPAGGDETFVAISILTRDFAGMLEPLDYAQVAPAGFMWLELVCKKLLGPSGYSLRLVPLLFALAALLIFRNMGGALARPREALLGLGFFAASVFLAYIQIKPYALDTFFGAALTLCIWRTAQNPEDLKQWLILGVASLAGLVLSYPSVFVAAGGVVFLAWTAFLLDGPRIWGRVLAYAAWVILVWALVFYFLARPQTAEADWLWSLDLWRNAYFPWQSPWLWPGWLLSRHAGEMSSYPMWDDPLNGKITFALIAIGCAALIRRGQAKVVGLLLCPLPPALAASALGMYPYGGSSRTMLYMAPAFCLLAGVGLCNALKLILPKRWAARGIGLAALLFGVWALHSMLSYQGPFTDNQYSRCRQAIKDIAALGGPDDLYYVAGLKRQAQRHTSGGSGVEPSFRFNLLSMIPGRLIWADDALPPLEPGQRVWLLASRDALCRGVDELAVAHKLQTWRDHGLSLYRRVFEPSPYWSIEVYAAQDGHAKAPQGFKPSTPEQAIWLQPERPGRAWRHPQWVAGPAGKTPPNALMGGQDARGEPLAICRAEYNQALHVGYLIPQGCRIGWGGRQMQLGQFEVLIAQEEPGASAKGGGKPDAPRYGWRRFRPYGPPAKLLSGGRFKSGKAMPVCRAYHAGGVWPGKQNNQVCNFAWRGKELIQRNFEVLAELPPKP